MKRGNYDLSYVCRGCGETVYIIGAPHKPLEVCGMCRLQDRVADGGAPVQDHEVRFSPTYRACALPVVEDGEFVAIELHPLDDKGELETWSGGPILAGGPR